ncbi:hypothetical protein CCAX7_20830 [Capsulimonas corticalis]|uniref:Uncharacterized protein n=1 Tax=Capsulimonas corticalis TaxID=2219043 RepID=A0A402D2E6_9BACT|nr:DUF4272 domain-containing protein [Capsulimonas corticalis]BDI30032.1 hypothetical protein CCAX7_20830 [Capsulimonas corticalis]
MTTLINIYSTLGAPPAPDFPHALLGSRGHGEPALAGHLNGFGGYVRNRSETMTQTLYHVLLHIERTRNQFSMNVEDADLAALAHWARRANGILFTPDGAVRDSEGRILVGANGESDPAAQVPYPADAAERKARTNATLTASGVPTARSLPPLISAEEVQLRTPSEVALRSLGLFIPCVRAESLNENDPLPIAELRNRCPVGFEGLTPAERHFLFAASPIKQDIINFAWRYEALAVLQWALRLSDSLPWPSQICDVPQAARGALDNNTKAFVQSATLRPAAEILDALDLHYRLHWAVTEARVQRQAPPANVNASVVKERHHALNWLVRFQNSDWDDVDTPT